MSIGPPSSRRKFFAAALGVASVALLVRCRRSDDVLEVDLSRTLPPDEQDGGTELRLAIGTMISPRETLRSYGQLCGWLGRRIGRRVVLVQRRSYAETNDLLLRGEADFAFVCTGAYAVVRNRGVQLLAVPVVGGKTTYRSLIIVHRDDAARDFEALRGSTVAFVDLLSLTGRLYPEALAARATADGGKFFGATVFTHSHTDSIAMVGDGRVRAAGVDSLVFDSLRRSEPEKAARVRVLAESEPFGIPPFVVRAGLAPELREKLRAALLAMHDDADGAKVLASLGFDSLVPGDERGYETARALIETSDGLVGAQ